jgi:hypothetical protein
MPQKVRTYYRSTFSSISNLSAGIGNTEAQVVTLSLSGIHNDSNQSACGCFLLRVRFVDQFRLETLPLTL